VPTYFKGAEAVRRTLDLRDAMQAVLDRYPDRIQLATTAGDLERTSNPGKLPRCWRWRAATRLPMTWPSCGCTSGWASAP
jgi:hypothetical protein